MSALPAYCPKCVFCRQPVGKDAVAVRVGSKLLGVACAPHAKVAMKTAIVARKYGPAFLRGFLKSRYPKAFALVAEAYQTLAETESA